MLQTVGNSLAIVTTSIVSSLHANGS